ncbi:hypothetical protein P3521_03715 [Vibrio parahaemolyticus]|uniref:hypothetical protein n=1 Tax=Vibrio parahaemolyticus TaxID=670 RepID=UPI00226B7979|nr:hypothetical protein [Vibrio parahaemolyticus]MCX8816978.1 hypothetical protein [Vibrio parahaemolyticus]MDF4579368.1 hypothetical protein [Vibrio parahaemolyticus]MDF4668709.1 hypothetical protein [Vibrio parahaemolyticus]HAV1412742.1 hypothetical protein [Vibrio parahaemolyticus]HAV2004825.1 hypothetical protein [Vibrio parahaemolyticus]
MIILLGLNFTLISNSEEKRNPFAMQVEHERYRTDLINAIKDNYVVLVTARSMRYMDATLKSIERKTQWQPDEWFFNTGLTPPLFCESILIDHIYPEHGAEVELLAIENNPKVRAMYSRYGIRSMTYINYMMLYRAQRNEKKEKKDV